VRERRVESGVVLTRRLPWGAATTVALGARGSHERDYLALGAHVGARAELAERNTTVEVRYEVERDGRWVGGRRGVSRAGASVTGSA
jgi:hypothetical protein